MYRFVFIVRSYIVGVHNKIERVVSLPRRRSASPLSSSLSSSKVAIAAQEGGYESRHFSHNSASVRENTDALAVIIPGNMEDGRTLSGNAVYKSPILSEAVEPLTTGYSSTGSNVEPIYTAKSSDHLPTVLGVAMIRSSGSSAAYDPQFDGFRVSEVECDRQSQSLINQQQQSLRQPLLEGQQFQYAESLPPATSLAVESGRGRASPGQHSSSGLNTVHRYGEAASTPIPPPMPKYMASAVAGAAAASMPGSGSGSASRKRQSGWLRDSTHGRAENCLHAESDPESESDPEPVLGTHRVEVI